MVRVPVPGKPGEPAKEWRWEPASDTSDREPKAWAAAARSVDPDKLRPLADRLLLAEGIEGGSLDAESREMLLDEMAKAPKQAFGARQRNAEGDYSPDPMGGRFPEEFSGAHVPNDADPTHEANDARASGCPRSASFSPKASPKVSLTGLVEDWWREAKAIGRKPSTRESYGNSMAALVAFLKHNHAGRVTSDDIIRFKAYGLAAINP